MCERKLSTLSSVELCMCLPHVFMCAAAATTELMEIIVAAWGELAAEDKEVYFKKVRGVN